MPLDPNTLYPEGYVEPAPAPTPPDDETTGRDFVWARNALDVAVPPGGPALKISQVVELICGTPDDIGMHLPTMMVIGNVAAAIAQVQLPRAQRTHRLIGPPRTASITRPEARQLVLDEIEERRSTWTEYEAP